MIRIVLIFILTCACGVMQAQVNIITTIAGKSPYGYSGDWGPATNAQLKAPARAYPNQIGDIFITDALNHCIRKITATTGIITTVAGKGTPGFSGDGGDAINAEFQVPQAIFIDKDDNLFICDGANNRIRKINASSNIITTIAGTNVGGSNGDGGLAISAQLNLPAGVFVDNMNNVYVADWGNNKIRKITFATGVITTIAGKGTAGYSGDGGLAVNAELNNPSQVVFDTSGNLLIAEQYNHTIRKVDLSTGNISTIAGNGVSGYSGDGGLAINARFNQPAGLFVDKLNNIFIAEYGNDTIRKIEAVSGIITTVAGIGVTGFSGDGGPATNAKLFCDDVYVDKYGNLIITDLENNRIRKVNNAVAVNGIDKLTESKLYPNPTKGVFTIQTPIGISLVNIYNIAGLRL